MLKNVSKCARVALLGFCHMDQNKESYLASCSFKEFLQQECTFVHPDSTYPHIFTGNFDFSGHFSSQWLLILLSPCRMLINFINPTSSQQGILQRSNYCWPYYKKTSHIASAAVGHNHYCPRWSAGVSLQADHQSSNFMGLSCTRSRLSLGHIKDFTFLSNSS